MRTATRLFLAMLLWAGLAAAAPAGAATPTPPAAEVTAAIADVLNSQERLPLPLERRRHGGVLLGDHRAQVAAVHVLHRDVVAAPDAAEVEDLHDVRVLKAGDVFGLGAEAGPTKEGSPNASSASASEPRRAPHGRGADAKAEERGLRLEAPD